MARTIRSKEEMRRLATRAKDMLLNDGMRQKDIAVALGLSEKTVSIWAKKYSWGQEKQQQLFINLSPNPLTDWKGIINLEGFAEYLKKADSRYYNKLLQHLSIYVLANSTNLLKSK